MYNPLLKTLVCVADCGSFNRASEQLFLSPPSIMKQINSLEKHLELRLVQRSAQGIHLTPAGQIVYKYAKQLFEQSESILQEARDAQNQEKHTFRIGSSLLNPCKPFMDLWMPISSNFPDYTLQIIPFEDTHTSILSQIEQLGSRYDFIVGVCDSSLWKKHCQLLPLGSYQHEIAVSRTHPLAQKKSLTIQDLYGQTLMMVKEGDSTSVDQIRKEIEKHPQIHIEDTSRFYDMNVFNHCAQSNACMVTIECWKDIHPFLVNIPIAWDFPITYGLLYALEPSPSVNACIRTIQETINA